jgi:hypothetical protein
MATAIATDRLSCRRKMLMYLHNPADASVLQSVKTAVSTATWQAFKGYGAFQAAAMLAVDTTALITLAIYAAEDSSGTNATEIKTSGVIAGATVGDWCMQECTAEEVNAAGKALGYDFTHIVAYIDCTHADDICAVVYILDDPLFKYDALTPATTIA